jgi:inner membrane protein
MQMKFFGIFVAMDSLTQIVLGAACGEIALGKKIGNKALLFGAIGGTIPDLDVFLGAVFYSNSIDAMAFHRGFMHSIVFAFIASYFLGLFIHKLYNTGKRIDNLTTRKDWTLLFFLSIFTHPILDSFTPYGTQLFLPFSDYRVALNNISVADPTYTLPFLFCLIVTMFYKRTNTKRLKWAKAGIYISSAYMLFTLGNKIYIDSVFKKSFEKANVSYLRFRAQPTILNNVLWYGIAETKSDYKIGYYSLFDKSATVNKFISIPKIDTIINMNQPDLKTMTWFSDSYYLIEKKENPSRIIYNDLRYVMNTNDSIKAMMNFELKKVGQRWITKPSSDFNPPDNFLSIFWDRIKGI